MNIVLGSEHLDQMTVTAASGVYTSDMVPIPGYLPNSDAEGQPSIEVAVDNIHVVTKKDETDQSAITKYMESIDELIERCQNEEMVPILNSVQKSSKGIQHEF